MTDTPAHSLPKRFLYKFSANLVGGLLSFFQASLVSRALGPRTYGDYNFLLNFFVQFVAFLEMRSSTYLYTSLSSKRENTGVAAFYVYLALAISLVTILFPVAAVTLGLQYSIWPDQSTWLILLVAVLSLTLWYTDLLAKLCDALGLTVSLEKTRVVNRVVFFIALALLMRWGLMNINSYVLVQFIANIALVGALAYLLRSTRAFSDQSFHPAKIEMRQTGSEFFAYSHPIFIYTAMDLASNYADRWLLQKFGGSIEQGLFSLAFNIGLAFNLFINALQPLMMREFSVAFATDNLTRARDVFRKLIPASYTLSAFFLCFAAVNADVFVRIIGGASFRNAAGVFAIVAFLPIIHNYSMLSGSALYAANKTKLIRNIGLVTMPLGIVATFFLIAPREYGGLDQGAIGLAIKIVALELIGSNIVLYFNCRMLDLKWRGLFAHQILVVALLTAVAYVCRMAAVFLPGGYAGQRLAELAASGILYGIICLALFLFVPSLVGINAREAMAFLKDAVKK